MQELECSEASQEDLDDPSSQEDQQAPAVDLQDDAWRLSLRCAADVLAAGDGRFALAHARDARTPGVHQPPCEPPDRGEDGHTRRPAVSLLPLVRLEAHTGLMRA